MCIPLLVYIPCHLPRGIRSRVYSIPLLVHSRHLSHFISYSYSHLYQYTQIGPAPLVLILVTTTTIAGRMANLTRLPPFHPDHPHNQPQYQSQYQFQHQYRSSGSTPLGQASLNLPFAPVTPPRRQRSKVKGKMSTSTPVDQTYCAPAADASVSLSPEGVRTCFCGNLIKDGEGIYCSAGKSNKPVMCLLTAVVRDMTPHATAAVAILPLTHSPPLETNG